jgi:hypothetical protein
MSRPTPPIELPTWGTNIASADITTPTSDLLLNGWTENVPKEGGGYAPPKPPYRFDNWFKVRACNAIAYCVAAISDLYSQQAIPSGLIMGSACLTVPDGWAACLHQQVSKIGTYANLYAAIGDQFSNGDTPTSGNFFLPDGPGRTLVGYKSGDAHFGTIGAVIGDVNLQEHSHPYYRYDFGSIVGGAVTSGTPKANFGLDNTVVAGTGSGGNIQPTLVIPAWIIKI